MSVIHVGHIKNEVLARFGNLIDLSDVQTAHADQKEICRLTRALGAFAISELSGLDEPITWTVR
jgi:hypothetical protein